VIQQHSPVCIFLSSGQHWQKTTGAIALMKKILSSQTKEKAE